MDIRARLAKAQFSILLRYPDGSDAPEEYSEAATAFEDSVDWRGVRAEFRRVAKKHGVDLPEGAFPVSFEHTGKGIVADVWAGGMIILKRKIAPLDPTDVTV